MDIKNIIKKRNNFVIGMVHCLPLPGTWHFEDNCEYVVERAIEDAITLEKAGCDAIMVENMCDDPLSVKLDTAQAVALSAIVARIREKVALPIGIDAAFCDYEVALSIAKFNNCQFVRIPVFVDRVQFFGGVIDPCARECVLYRKNLNAEDIMILADIQVKHTNLITPTPIEASAKNAVACGADAVIVTGSTTGESTPLEMIEKVNKVVNVPVIVGSGANKDNIKSQFAIADGAIIGSSLKEKGILTNPIIFEKVDELIKAIK
ncbi:MAG: BtpA/SgcQ family protein [Pleomorphochaeta sp.]